eukprot:TRINITY_DN1635_c0_g1_i1.p1 TRINITY_DN1635_c0_g1~~TRINITY_DN1635_c0_g1_i1.p1  ORF type:complete len:186 (-),score=52.18 TRINITY_DN1635_c0_g1_i1:21-578(-)
MEIILSVSKKYRLRPFKLEDNLQIAFIANDRRISINLADSFPFPYTIDDANFFIQNIANSNSSNDVHYVIEDTENDIVMGAMGIMFKNPPRHRDASVGYWLGVEYWGKGIISDCLPAFLLFCFNQKVQELNHISACVFSWNHKSAHILEKNRFTLEGTIRGNIYKDNKVCDELLYGITRDEFFSG